MRRCVIREEEVVSNEKRCRGQCVGQVGLGPRAPLALQCICRHDHHDALLRKQLPGSAEHGGDVRCLDLPSLQPQQHHVEALPHAPRLEQRADRAHAQVGGASHLLRMIAVQRRWVGEGDAFEARAEQIQDRVLSTTCHQQRDIWQGREQLVHLPQIHAFRVVPVGGRQEAGRCPRLQRGKRTAAATATILQLDDLQGRQIAQSLEGISNLRQPAHDFRKLAAGVVQAFQKRLRL
mmetsp:Transcript_171970/g.551197  ORF Transcript_171970/g.551197 Transcript_171970/m.551197 type:complete len:235 (+) Transcript_171970:1467-2171(+)